VENIKILSYVPDLDINAVDSYGFTPLIKSCASMSYDAALFLLDNNNSNFLNILINKQDKTGNTALHYTMEDNNFNVSLAILKRGGQYDIKNQESKTCFDMIKDVNIKSVLTNYISQANENGNMFK
jgi:ankyrin repeat protein